MAIQIERVAKLANFITSISSSYNRRHLVYTGITDDISRRLREHGINEEDTADYTFEKCDSSNEARETEEYIKTRYCTDGDSGGGNDNSCYIYSYRKKSGTTP
ncbi:MAG: hypothetical protein GX638_09825 [Crenarchaeota archaeon]|nr:hypothetical protein [Thermoproteota archaeon]